MQQAQLAMQVQMQMQMHAQMQAQIQAAQLMQHYALAGQEGQPPAAADAARADGADADAGGGAQAEGARAAAVEQARLVQQMYSGGAEHSRGAAGADWARACASAGGLHGAPGGGEGGGPAFASLIDAIHSTAHGSFAAQSAIDPLGLGEGGPHQALAQLGHAQRVSFDDAGEGVR